MHLLLNTIRYFLLAGMLVLAGCQLQGKGPSDPDKKDITQRDLYRAASSQKKILLVDGWENNIFRDNIRELIKDSHLRNWQFIIKDHREVTKEEIANTPTMLIGTPDQNIWIKQLMSQLPIGINGEKINVSTRMFDANSHSLVLSYYPNPLNVRMPIGLFTSGQEALVWQLTSGRIMSFLRGNWNYEILNGSQRILLGNLSQQPDSRWEVDDNQQIELPTSVKNQWESIPFNFRSYSDDLNTQTMLQFTKECDREFSDIKAFCNADLPDRINYYLYPTTEIKGLMTGNTDQSHADFEKNEVHTAFNDHFSHRYSGMENQLLLRKLLGHSSSEAMEVGLALFFSAQWGKDGYLYWSKHLIDGGNSLTVERLLDTDQFNSASGLVREALAGSFIHFLIKHWDKETFLKRYSSWQPDAEELAQINIQWQSWVKAQDLEVSPVSKKELPYLEGFNFTHEGYQIYNGYGSELSQQSLEYVRNIGSNAVAIVPYSWMGDPEKPSRFRFSDRAGSENDEGVIHALSKARQQGLYTILKPHVWISNSWPGEVSMSSESDWDLFFENYFLWISHYALMAEMYQVDMLCIGVEFSIATLNQKDRWRQLIKRLRKIYSGNLTYAANWGAEFENIEFWDELDFIGLNCYYPLSKNPLSTQQELEQGFSAVLQKINQVKLRFNKPVLFTEIGFRSVKSPWIQPHEEAAEKEFSEQDQAMAYSAVFQAMADQPVVDGILWWKWPTNMDLRNGEDRRFVPSEKKAEQVIRYWFE